MLIDKESREMLDLLLVSEPDCPRRSFSYDRICELSGLDEERMFPIVKGLVEKGLAEPAYRSSSAGRRDVGIALTQSGIKYRELRSLERRERWKERAYGFFSGVLLTILSGVIIQTVAG